MTNTKEQVLEMVAAGKISAAEGDELLNAMQAPASSGWRVLLNPFTRLSTAQSLVLGVVGAAGGIGLSHWGVRFDGALDMHVGTKAVSLSTAVIDQLVGWPLLALVFWLVALAAARRGRAIDFIGSVGVARLPMLPLGALAAALRDQLPADSSQLATGAALPLALLMVVTIPGIIWVVLLLFRGFATASGLQGSKAKSAFVAAVLAAEVLSKLALLAVSAT